MLDRGILGMNKRNKTYIREFNPEKGIRLANNKIQTKKFLTQRGIPVPATLAHIKTNKNWLEFDFGTIQASSFVIKPNKGSKGKGIFIIKERRKRENIEVIQEKNSIYKFLSKFGLLRTQKDLIDYGYEFFIDRKRVSEKDLKYEAEGIFNGFYSSSNKSDSILLEDKLIAGVGFNEFCEYGLADMRVILFNLVPIIAMLRMPTKESGGKANLAQGGIGLGLDIVTGKITSLYRKGESYTNQFPEERKHFKGKKIPYRQDIIQYSANAQYFVNIGYLGMDRVITNKGPKLLEINARSGLEIQNITGKPLLSIMQKIEDIEVNTPNKGIEISKSLFSDERINEVKEQYIVYLSQTGKLLYHKDKKKKGLPVTIVVGIDKTKNYASEKIIKRLIGAENISVDLGHHDTIFQNISLLSSKEVQGNKIILGQQSLANYYIKPIHKSKVSTRALNPECFVEDELVSLKTLDEKISEINKQLNLAQILKPTNYLDQFDLFVSHYGNYNPQFTYNFPTYKILHTLTTQIKELDTKYRQKEYFDSSFANLFFDKLDEMQLKINLIKAYKKQNFGLIERYNKTLFGSIDEQLLSLSKQKIEEGIAFSPNELGKIIKGDDIIAYIKGYIAHKKIEGVRVKRNDSGLSKISVGFGKFATIKVKSTAMIREHKLISKLIHEVDVHTMRYLNGKKTGWNILTTGTAHYLETEEGLAIYLANKKLEEVIPSYDGIAKYKNYYRASQSSQLNFAELFQCICSTKNTVRGRGREIVNYKALFNTLLKFTKGKKDTSIKNTGIIFGKNLLYLNGYHKIEQLYQENSNITKQLIKYGKIKDNDLSFFK